MAYSKLVPSHGSIIKSMICIKTPRVISIYAPDSQDFELHSNRSVQATELSSTESNNGGFEVSVIL